MAVRESCMAGILHVASACHTVREWGQSCRMSSPCGPGTASVGTALMCTGQVHRSSILCASHSSTCNSEGIPWGSSSEPLSLHWRLLRRAEAVVHPRGRPQGCRVSASSLGGRVGGARRGTALCCSDCGPTTQQCGTGACMQVVPVRGTPSRVILQQ